MNEHMTAAADQAEELLPGALATLGELMVDGNQTGPVRVSAARAIVDYALKLGDQRDADAQTLERLDALIAEGLEFVGDALEENFDNDTERT